MKNRNKRDISENLSVREMTHVSMQGHLSHEQRKIPVWYDLGHTGVHQALQIWPKHKTQMRDEEKILVLQNISYTDAIQRAVHKYK